jgi:hypothetical protein
MMYKNIFIQTIELKSYLTLLQRLPGLFINF